MNFWKADDQIADSGSVLTSALTEFVKSPTLSPEPEDSSTEATTNINIENSTPKLLTNHLAKKRLQAYDSSKKFKGVNALKEESVTVVESTVKTPLKKAKKIYPDDTAKAVIREIEDLKKVNYGGFFEKSPKREPTALLVTSISSTSAASIVSDQDDKNAFKKREIKCRNIRKSENLRQKSVSPKMKPEISEHINKNQLPTNWTEYKNMGLCPEKYIKLIKSKLAKTKSKAKERKFEFKKYFNFETPSLPTEPFKCHTISGENIWIPFPYLRCTATKPPIFYCTNPDHKSNLTKRQLFALIPKDRQYLIEKLYKPCKIEFDHQKTLTSRKWFQKNWKKSDNIDGKLLESSIGLSFLQTYSDEEDNIKNTEKNNLKNNEVNQDSFDILPEKYLPSPQTTEEILNKTPPIVQKEEKEEGEVSEDEPQENLSATVIEEINEIKTTEEELQKTKEELEKLEATLKTSDNLLKSISTANTEVIMPKIIKKKQKDSRKQHRKVHNNKIDKNLKKNKSSKKSSSKDSYIEKSESEKRRQKRKNLKTKSADKERKSKAKQKKYIKIDIDKKEKKKKKKKLIIEKKKSETPDRAPDDYQDDIKFFAERLDAERQLKGKTKHKTKINISLEEFNLDQKIEATPPELKDDHKTNKKDEIKVDLLKMNEEYLREQKRLSNSRDRSNSKEKIKKPDDIAEKKEEISNLDSIKIKEVIEEPTINQKKHIRKDSVTQEDVVTKENADLIDSVLINIKKETLSPVIAKDKANSWESDEDIQFLDNETTKNTKTILDLEMPLNIKTFSRRDLDPFDIATPSTPKKGRWDIKTNTPTKIIKPKEIIDPNNLEDEYEEFMKAVRNEPIVIDNSQESLCKPPVPVPSPKILDLNQPLINLSLSANLTQNITLSLATTSSISTPITPSIDVSKPTQGESRENVNVFTPQKVIDNMNLTPTNILLNKNMNQDIGNISLNKDMNYAIPPQNIKEVKIPVATNRDTGNVNFAIPPQNIKDVKIPTTTNQDIENNFAIPPQSIKDMKIPVATNQNVGNMNLVIPPQNIKDGKFPVATNQNVGNMNLVIPPQNIKDIKVPVATNQNIGNMNFAITPQNIKDVKVPVATNQEIGNVNVAILPQNIQDINFPAAPNQDIADINFAKNISLNKDTNVILPQNIKDTNNPVASNKDIGDMNFSKNISLNDDMNFPLAPNIEISLNKNVNCSIPSQNIQDMILTTNTSLKKDILLNQSKNVNFPFPNQNIQDKHFSTPPNQQDIKDMIFSVPTNKTENISPTDKDAFNIPLNKDITDNILNTKEPEPDWKQTFKPIILPTKNLLGSTKLNLEDFDDNHEDFNPQKLDVFIEEKSKKSTRKPSPHKRREPSPKRSRKYSPGKRRDSSPRRRKSPRRSPKRRSPPRRTTRRSISPKRRVSPRRRLRSPSPRKKPRYSPSRNKRRSKSPVKRQHSPLKNIADSTISDDQLNFAKTHKETTSNEESPQRLPLDIRINQVLGINQSENYPQEEGYQQYEQYDSFPTKQKQNTYKQVGNMLQILPADEEPLLTNPEPPRQEEFEVYQQFTSQPRSQIVQMGNVLEIVPTEMVLSESQLCTEIKTEKIDDQFWFTSPKSSESELKRSAETTMLQKETERIQERENRRLERENRKKEKERRRKEREKIREAKLKVKTEKMIKKALELEIEEELTKEATEESQVQWPPTPLILNHSNLKGKGILIANKLGQSDSHKITKVVQFADGIRPGEGTSPSAGEELFSPPPPPSKKLPKGKRFKKTLFAKKKGKKKVKVKIIKKPPSPLESDSEDTLPPPSPPPGSPPSHIYPPRIKVNAVNNVPASLLASMIQTAQHQQQYATSYQPSPQPSLYRPPINMMMVPPPPPPQGHHIQSPALPPVSPQFHPGLTVPPPPPPPQNGHNRHF